MNMLTKLMLGFVGLALSLPAAAEWKPSPAEMAMLPSFCAARFDEKSEAFKSLRASMGPDFMHVHHYCAGLNLVNRARGTFSSERQGILVAAVREFDYVLDHASAGFSMRPEILMNRGIALTMLKRNGEAVGNLMKSIELDPSQPRAYLTLADLYLKLKNHTKALETVTEGLRHNPDTKSLQRRYIALGGKLPYPAAIEPAAVEAQTAAPNVSSATVSAPAGEPAAEAQTSAPAAAESVVEPKIGSPTNPYCRFCPD